MRREGEIVLIYYQDQPTVFARVEAIEPDLKKDWFQITLLMLTLPTQSVTWILRESYIDGAPFTMGGTPMRLETVERRSIAREPEAIKTTEKKSGRDKPGRVIPFKKP
jgi:hypothetical protein